MTEQSAEASEDPERVPSRRERARAATVDEIKQTAIELMREQGTTDFRFSDIARVMGMTAPALYRYFADRDQLLTDLIVDAYDDLGATVADRRERVPRDDVGGRFYAVAQTYRQWARDEPTRFALILGMPVPGYAAPEEGPTTEAARSAMLQLKSLFFDAAEQGVLNRPLVQRAPEVVHDFAVDREDPLQPDGRPQLPADTFQAILYCWSTLHGFASLESYGHLQWLPGEVVDAVFDTTILQLCASAGLPPPSQLDPGEN